MTLKNILKTPFELPEYVLQFLLEHSRMVTFRKGACIINPGEENVPLYFLAAGLARIYYPATENVPNDVNILFGEAGNVATSLSNFMLGIPAVFGVGAVTPVKAYVIQANAVRSLYKSSPDFCRWLMELALLQLAHLEVRHTYHSVNDPYTRFLNFIRFKPKSFMRRVPGYHIASYIGVTPSEYAILKDRYEREDSNVEYDKQFLDDIGITGMAPEE